MIKIEKNNNIKNNNSSKKRIMIVDDEPDVISVLKIVLEENGFQVDSFEDAIAALKNYKTGLYDLLILDIKMPEMDGFELYDEIKKRDDRAKVCFLTASEMYYKKSRKEKYCLLDKDLFIQKPIENEELVKEINKMISRPD
jgi:CheY-like chemotaxis protein